MDGMNILITKSRKEMLVRTPQLMTSNLHQEFSVPDDRLHLFRNTILSNQSLLGEQAVFSRLADGVDWRFLNTLCLGVGGQHWVSPFNHV